MRRKVAHFHGLRLQSISYQGCLTSASPTPQLSVPSILPQLENPLFSYSFTKANRSYGRIRGRVEGSRLWRVQEWTKGLACGDYFNLDLKLWRLCPPLRCLVWVFVWSIYPFSHFLSPWLIEVFLQVWFCCTGIVLVWTAGINGSVIEVYCMSGHSGYTCIMLKYPLLNGIKILLTYFLILESLVIWTRYSSNG